MNKKIFKFGLFLFFCFPVLSSAEELKDVKPPLDLPANFWWIYFVVGLLALGLLAVLFRFLLKSWKAKSKPLAVPPLPPWVVAYQQLEQLVREDLPRQGRIKEYYIRLSDIVRRYIEGRFSIQAPEMTTEESLFSLRTSQALNENQKNFLKEFLICCDMVKFAKYQSNTDEMQKGYRLARQLVDETSKVSSDRS